MMKDESMNYHDDTMRQAVRCVLDPGPMPDVVQKKVKNAYAMLAEAPQQGRPHTVPGAPDHVQPDGKKRAGFKGKRMTRRVVIVAAAVATLTLLCGAAYAVNQLLTVGPNGAGFFNGSNLPVYNSMEESVASLSADVGQSQTVGTTTMTLDTVACDRNIINLFFTMEVDGGIDLDALSNYEGSQEGTWARLQQLIPHFDYTITADGQTLDEGFTRQLDAYMEDGKMKCMLRIIPAVSLPSQVSISLHDGLSMPNTQVTLDGMSFTADLDLSSVTAPRELGAQDIIFHTDQGDKNLSIERFTASEFGTVFVASNSTVWDKENQTFNTPDNAMYPQSLKISDSEGNVLTFVDPGDGAGYNPAGRYVYELSGTPDIENGITFTPMLFIGSSTVSPEHIDDNKHTFDVSQIGTKLEISEFGGYELTGWDVLDGTVTISLKPYGWVPEGHAEVSPDNSLSITRLGSHLGITYTKMDYATGELQQIDSYYAAKDDELKAIHAYHYRSAFGVFSEDTDAAVTLTGQ